MQAGRYPTASAALARATPSLAGRHRLQLTYNHFLEVILMTNEYAKRIAELNDQCRAGHAPCQLILTQGISALPLCDQAAILNSIARYDRFTPDNDPYGERDFGSITHTGERIFWKIDYYAPDLQRGSDDPADPTKTVRVLTVMLAEEY